jgi:hypothetical protein
MEKAPTMHPTTDIHEQPRFDELEGFDRFTPADFFIALAWAIVLVSLAVLCANLFASAPASR